jgi:hypothetical protein
MSSVFSRRTANDERATSAQCDVTSLDAASFFNSIKFARPFPLSISASCYTREKRVEWCVCVCLTPGSRRAARRRQGVVTSHIIISQFNGKSAESFTQLIIRSKWKIVQTVFSSAGKILPSQKGERDTPTPSHHSHSIAQLHPADSARLMQSSKSSILFNGH